MANKSKDNFPKNIGIIMDGNGRWALKNSFKISEGHKKGVEVVREIVEESVKLNIESLNLYAFSSENWQRPKAEINAIKKLVIDAINAQVPELKEQKVQLKFFGHTEDFGEKIINKIEYAELETFTKDKNMNLNVALSYGGQQDILDIIRGVSINISEGKNLSSAKNIQFKISDNLSGIETYAAFIDEMWVLGKYVPKRGTFIIPFDKYNNISKGKHLLKVLVKDERGNETIKEYNFIR